MKCRNVNSAYSVRMMSLDQAAAYIGLGRSRTREILHENHARRKLGRRTVYDKLIIDAWLDNLPEEVEG